MAERKHQADRPERIVPINIVRKLSSGYFKLSDGCGGQILFIMNKDGEVTVIRGNMMLSRKEIAATPLAV